MRRLCCALAALLVHASMSIPVKRLKPMGYLSHIHVVYTADAGAFTGLFSSMLSLSRSLAEPEDCTIHLAVPSEDAAQAQRLVQCLWSELGAGPSPVVLVHAVEKAMPFDPLKMALHPQLMGSKAVYYKFYLQDILPSVERVLYLDTDVIVKADIGPLYRMPMEHAYACSRERAPIGSVLMAMPFNSSYMLEYMPNRSLPQLQTGVALMDLQRWKSERITHALEDWTTKLHTYSDDLLLNLEFLFRRGFDSLGQEWNMYGLGLNSAFERWISSTPSWTPAQLADARILHFSGSRKPWTYRPKANQTNSYWEEYRLFAPRQRCVQLKDQVQ